MFRDLSPEEGLESPLCKETFVGSWHAAGWCKNRADFFPSLAFTFSLHSLSHQHSSVWGVHFPFPSENFTHGVQPSPLFRLHASLDWLQTDPGQRSQRDVNVQPPDVVVYSAACVVRRAVAGKSSVCCLLINSSSFANRLAPEARPAIISQTHSRLCVTPDRSNKQMFSQTQMCESRCKKTHCTSFVCFPDTFRQSYNSLRVTRVL